MEKKEINGSQATLIKIILQKICTSTESHEDFQQHEVNDGRINDDGIFFCIFFWGGGVNYPLNTNRLPCDNW